MLIGLYDEDRAAQVVAYMLHLGGGKLDLLKLTKLCYLAEKHSYATYGEPLTGDRMSSLEHGPVLGDTYDETKRIHPEGVWAKWLKKRDGNAIALAKDLVDPADELDALSRADFRVIDETWKKFGRMGTFALRDWTHVTENCPEWDDPGKSSKPIRPESLFKSIGLTAEGAEERKSYLASAAKLRRALAAC